MSSDPKRSALLANRQTFIGGSDARTIMGDDEVARPALAGKAW